MHTGDASRGSSSPYKDVHSMNLVGKQDQLLEDGGDVFLISLHFLVTLLFFCFHVKSKDLRAHLSFLHTHRCLGWKRLFFRREQLIDLDVYDKMTLNKLSFPLGLTSS